MQQHPHHDPDTIELPTPTAWPIVSAFGLTLLVAGLVTNLLISAVGFIVGLLGAVGWFSDVFPHPKHEPVPVNPDKARPAPIRTQGRVVQMLKQGNIPHRAHVPTEFHPYRIGVIGGLAGGLVMAVLACIWGVVFEKSLWYPINLMAATGVPELGASTLAAMHNFSAAGLIVGTIAHITLSVLVGLLYAVLVPMFPRKTEFVLGAIVGPLLWTALVWSTLHWVSPMLSQGINWPWFVFCQIAFGAVCGWVVFKSGKMATMQSWSLAQKMGVESQHRDEESH